MFLLLGQLYFEVLQYALAGLQMDQRFPGVLVVSKLGPLDQVFVLLASRVEALGQNLFDFLLDDLAATRSSPFGNGAFAVEEDILLRGFGRSISSINQYQADPPRMLRA